ncbi:MAG: GroES family chaperonin [Nitrospirota bacterium]
MKIQPLNDWAVVVPSEAMTRTAGGIIIPDAAKEKPAEGTVEAIGPGALEEEKWEEKKKEKGKRKERKFIPTSVKPGERIMYDPYAGQKITLGGVERVLVRERNILGILPPELAWPQEELPPLMLPAATSTDSSKALAKRASTSVMVKKEATKPVAKKAAKKKAQGAKSKAKPKAKKAVVKKAAAKPKKAAGKKSAVKKKAKKKR